jgi:hypothetical protein
MNGSSGMDRGLWITWYNLPDDGRNTYLSWLHERYLPAMLRRTGFLWAAHYASIDRGTLRPMLKESAYRRTQDAAVPAGDRYILLFGAEDAHVFGAPTPSALHAGLPAADRKMLAMRSGERVNIMAEAARVEGPAAKGREPGMALGPCIQIGSFQCDWQDEEDMLAWYAQARMFAMRTLPGCIRTRRLASISGWAKHAILYEFVSLEARNQHFPTHEDGHPAIKAWTERVVPTLLHAPGSSNVALRLWPAATI